MLMEGKIPRCPNISAAKILNGNLFIRQTVLIRPWASAGFSPRWDKIYLQGGQVGSFVGLKENTELLGRKTD